MPSIYLNFGPLSVSVSYKILTYEIRVNTHDQHKNKHENEYKSNNSLFSKSLDSYLSREEVIGLVNLKKRINQGSLVIVSTDKSKRLLLSLENSTWNLAYNTPNTFKM